jgi:peptidoglycan/xylan/chitin deacetylase (PgdA/CDA1 family)
MFLKAPKAALASVLYRTGLLGIGGVGVNGRLIVFNYHRISPGSPDFAAPFDDGVYGPSPNVFEQQVKWLQKNTRVLSEPDLLEIISREDRVDLRRSPSELCSLITFDDGYLDNYALAYPILKRLGAPATFFIPSHLIQSRTVGWWDSIAYLLKRTQKTAIHWNGEVYSLRDRAAVAKSFNTKMALQPAGETRDLVQRLADACGEPLPDAALQSSQLMNWDQIREISRDMTIGSHSHTHTVLATMDAAAQKEDMALSKSILEREIGKPVASLAYPVGGYQHFTRETQKAAAECGFRIAFSFATGTNSWPDINRLAIARVSSPATMSLTVAKARIPRLFALK